MDKSELDEIWILFEQDGIAALKDAEKYILSIEKHPTSYEDLNGLYRSLHSLKGNAKVMGLKQLEALTHKTEDIVGIYRRNKQPFTDAPLLIVLQTCDVVRNEFTNIISAREDIAPALVTELIQHLDKTIESLKLSTTDVSSEREGALFEDTPAVEFDFGLIESQPETTSESAAPTPDAPHSPVAPTAKEPPQTKTRRRRDALIQVRSSKIQELLSIASDLGLSTDALLANPKIVELSENSEDMMEQAHRLRRLMRDLRFSAASLALIPVAELFAKVRRIARN
ncbi:MAG: Hpt domain-containing protein, partial [Myxococcota bacterium]